MDHFKVINVTDMITEMNLQLLCTAKVSDHNMLECSIRLDGHLDEFRISIDTSQNSPEQDYSTGRNGPFDKPPQRYRNSALPADFLKGNDIIQKCKKMIEELLTQKLKQAELDTLYDRYVSVHHEKMAEFLKALSNTPK